MEKNKDIIKISEEDLDQLMADILSGNSTSAQEEELEEWIAADASHAEEYDQVKSFWNADMSDRFEVNAEKELAKLMKRVDASTRRKNIFSARNIWISLTVAAALVVGVVMGWSFKQTEVIESKQYSLITGESISTFRLPDGSVVHLNKNSRLDYNGSFGKGIRKVQLTGEGYFDVKRMEDCRFVVDLDGANITVKGTSFNAFNNEDSGLKGAALVSGSIEFTSQSQSVMLTPSRQALYDSVNNELTISVFDPALVTDWKDMLFRYKSLTISELADQVMEVYGIKVVLVQDMPGDKYSGAIDITLPANNVMDLISMQTGTKWMKKNGVYYISAE